MGQRAAGSSRTDWIRWLVLSALINVTLTGAAVVMLRWPTRASMRIEIPEDAMTRDRSIAVYVSGAVVEPGVYWLARGGLVVDAVHAAGGVTDEADTAAINLARRLSDGEQVHVPRVGEAASSKGGGTDPMSARLNVNAASAEELEELPGIGPTLSARIVAYRDEHGPFSSPDELQNVEGIGAGTMERIRAMITTR